MDKDCVDLFRSGQGYLEACFSGGVDIGVSNTCGEFLDYLRYCQLRKKAICLTELFHYYTLTNEPFC